MVRMIMLSLKRKESPKRLQLECNEKGSHSYRRCDQFWGPGPRKIEILTFAKRNCDADSPCEHWKAAGQTCE